MAVLTVGKGQGYGTITAAVAAAHTGDTINVQAGTYVNDFPALINGLTIQGVGGMVHLVATAPLPNGKAIFDVAGNTMLQNLDFSGATATSGTAAGVRYEGGNLSIENSSFRLNQEGLTGVSDPAGTITIDQADFASNGVSSGQANSVDVGNIAKLSLTYCYIHDTVGGSGVTSRAEATYIERSQIADYAGTGSYAIDLPNGGEFTLTESYLEKGANARTDTMIRYGEAGSLRASNSITMSFNEFLGDRASSSVLSNASGAAVNSSYNSYWNVSDGWYYGSDTNQPISFPTDSPVDTGSSDGRPPVVTAGESVSGWTSFTANKLSGTVSDGESGVAAVEVLDRFQGKTIDLGAATLNADGSWQYVASGLANGRHEFLLQAYDNAGNLASVSAGPAEMVDRVAPLLMAGQSVSGTTSSRGIVLSGTISDGGSGVAMVELFDQTGGKWADLGQATVTGSSWQFTKGDLTVGTHSFFARATDAVGNSSIAAADLPVTVVGTMAVQPALQRIIGNVDGGVTLLGTASANNTVTITETNAGVTQTLGSVTANAAGTFTLTSHSKLSLATINTFTVSATDTAGHQDTGTGLFQLSSAASDTLSGTVGQSDVFATFLRTGQDVIAGFETTRAVGAAHDVINLSGTGYGSYAQLAPHISGANSALIQLDATRSVTLLGIAATALQANDFRFS